MTWRGLWRSRRRRAQSWTLRRACRRAGGWGRGGSTATRGRRPTATIDRNRSAFGHRGTACATSNNVYVAPIGCVRRGLACRHEECSTRGSISTAHSDRHFPALSGGRGAGENSNTTAFKCLSVIARGDTQTSIRRGSGKNADITTDATDTAVMRTQHGSATRRCDTMTGEH